LVLTGCSYSFFEKPSNYPPGTTTFEFPDYDHNMAEQAAVKKLPSEIALEAQEFFQDIFQLKDVGQLKCTNVDAFQKFVKMFFVTAEGVAPELISLCLFKPDADTVELNWYLSKTDNLVWNLLPPSNLIDTDLSIIKSIDVYVESSARSTITSGLTTLYLDGVRFSLSKKAIANTPYSWLPEALLKFDVDSIEIYDDGRYVVKLKLPFGIPITYNGAIQTFVFSRNHSLRFHGHDFQLSF
jgi:hypothetical protein